MKCKKCGKKAHGDDQSSCSCFVNNEASFYPVKNPHYNHELYARIGKKEITVETDVITGMQVVAFTQTNQ